MRGRCVALLILNLGTRWGGRRHTAYFLPHEKQPSVLTEKDLAPNHESVLRKSKQKAIILCTQKNAATHTAIIACGISVVAKICFQFSPS